MSRELSFRAPAGDRARPSDPAPLVALLLLVFGIAVLTRPWWGGTMPQGVVVEVRGDVPRPGHHRVHPATVEAALRAAGVVAPPADARRVPEGHQVRVAGSRATVHPPSDPLLVGLPIDVDHADAHAFTAIPGVGATTAAKIVADRERRGPFRSVDDLARVAGVSPAAVDRMRPFVVAKGTGPIDLNRAPAARLELLPGVGPALARRIVVHRDTAGPFSTVDELVAIDGIGPTLIRRLEGNVTVGEP